MIYNAYVQLIIQVPESKLTGEPCLIYKCDSRQLPSHPAARAPNLHMEWSR